MPKAKPRPKPRASSASQTKTKPKPAPPAGRRIFIVDDHPMMLEGMSRLIDSEPGLLCCGTATSAESALAEIERTQPDLVITDLTLPNRSGLDLIKDIKATFPKLLVFVYSMHDEMFYAERALRAGARGYLMKEAGSEAMLAGIQRVLAGEMSISPRIASRILDVFSGHRPTRSASPIEGLTDREFDVYQLMGEGRSTKEIAARLHLSAKTVAVHRDHIKEKLGLGSAAELSHHAIRWVENKADRERE